MRRRERPRVVIVAENLPVARDHRVRKQAATLLAAGIDVTVICRRDKDNRNVVGVRVLGYPPPPEHPSLLGYAAEYVWSWCAAAVLFAHVLATTGYDGLQLCGAPDIYVPFAWLSRALGKPVVYDQRDPSPETYDARAGDEGSRLVRALLVRLERATCRAANRIIVVNSTLRALVGERAQVAPWTVTVVGNGPRPEDVAAAHRCASLTRGRAHLCCWAGVMGRQDHVDLALRAVADLVSVRGDDCTYAFIGDGETRAECERLAAALGVGHVTEFTGWLPQDRLFTYLATADVAVETNREPFVSPVKVLEYVAFAVPSVAFDLAETRAVAGEAAVYVPLDDTAALAGALSELLDNPGRRSAMARVARSRFSGRLSWDVQARRYLDIYDDLLIRDSRRRPRREDSS